MPSARLTYILVLLVFGGACGIVGYYQGKQAAWKEARLSDYERWLGTPAGETRIGDYRHIIKGFDLHGACDLSDTLLSDSRRVETDAVFASPREPCTITRRPGL